ncbi:hypothetical protein GEV33_003794 [Tenebrio molitor]|uniref:Peptidoglycan recognition protein family domain-containing protein n=1 Tax=Tenebrio molitor TaxID=7067 RepID=A0A8J6HRH4_TENMO|nr:hypothetical protein GEV33_003794 [Tenebrio molitor]
MYRIQKRLVLAYDADVESLRHQLIQRSNWGGDPPLKQPKRMKGPADLVIIAHTATKSCSTIPECSQIVAALQKHHLQTDTDIRYNFLIGGDSNMYVGRGWGANNPQRNQSISSVAEGVALGKLDDDYIIVCHNQTEATAVLAEKTSLMKRSLFRVSSFSKSEKFYTKLKSQIPERDHHRTTCLARSCILPAGSQQTPRPRSAEDPTRLLRENFFRLRPSPPPSCHKNEKQQRRSKIRRIQKVVRPDNDSILVDVTLSPGRRTPVDEDPPFSAGLWSRFLGEWGRRPSDPGKNLSANWASVATTVDLFIEGPPNPPPALGVGPHRTHDPTSGSPSRLHTFTLELPVHHSLFSFSLRRSYPPQKPHSGRRECLPRDGDGGKVLKRNSTYVL